MRIVPRLSPATRLAIGLVSLTVSLVLLVDLFSGFLSHRVETAQKLRSTEGELLAAEVALASNPEDHDLLRPRLAAALKKDSDLLSAAVVKADGKVLASIGDHSRFWTLANGAHSTLDNIRTEIYSGDSKWGDVQLSYKPVVPATIAGWIRDPLLQGLIMLGLLGFVAFWLYLRRMLRYLDPNSAVPEHVRTAFDTLTEGLLVIDTKGNIMLANKAFSSLHADDRHSLLGVSASSLTWLRRSLRGTEEELPWRQTMADNSQQLGVELKVEVPPHGRRELIMNCSPITDEGGTVRGCLATFSDVTELHERTERLRIANDKLAHSQEQIRLKNEELTRLATRDALTGCLNRRALMTEAERSLADALRDNFSLCCVMADIDHFKSINDRHGHGVGDQAIQAVSAALQRHLRSGDLLGRYGGEEFCIILPKTTRRQALRLAERMRAEVEANAGAAINDVSGIELTSSFGVADLQAQMREPMALINLADRALYKSKESGRNRVTAALSQDVAQREEDSTQFELPGCLNQHALMVEAEQSLAEARQANLSLCCILATIDRFESINERYGADVAGQVIEAVATILQGKKRSEDILGCYGADGFCIVLPRTTRRKALLIAESMRAEVEASAGTTSQPAAGFSVTCSFGVAQLDVHMRTPIDLVEDAGRALAQPAPADCNRVASSFDTPRSTGGSTPFRETGKIV